MKLFPSQWLKDVVLDQTNKRLARELTWGEFLRYLGLWFLMSSVGSSFKKKDFWNTVHFDEREQPCPYFLGKFMSLKWFEQVTHALTFTDVNKPTFRDQFWEIPQAVIEWNKNIADVFSSGRVLCLDESISIWHSMWTCPGWVFCPPKPHPFGN